jgi:hypothetical protein
LKRAVGATGVACVVALAAAGCDAGVNGRTGLGSLMQASGATLVPGALSSESDPTVTDGPTVTISQFHGLAFAGATNRGLMGSVKAGQSTGPTGMVQNPGRSVALGLADDDIYWIVPAATANLDVGGGKDLLFSTTLSYASHIAAGRHDLVLRAIMADGRMGPLVIQAVMISDFADVQGTLDVRLSWSTNADLDLHVVVPVTPASPPDPKAPAEIEVWVNNPSSLPPRPVFDPYTPEDITNGGLLDFDSNGSCVIDGRRQENVVWGAAPPSGMYTVRVDAVSMCGEVFAQWQVDVFLNGNPVPVDAAYGEAVDTDTRFSHTEGSGVLALQFQIP